MTWAPPRLLSPDDDTSGFSSNNDDLDEWLARFALTSQRSDTARVYVTTRDDGAVAGYYTLTSASVLRASAPRRAGHGAPDPVPALLLGRLAVDVKDQGRGVGSSLLRDAIVRTVEAAEAVGIRVLLVHAFDEAAARFYLRHDFERSPTDPLHLMLLMKDARRALRSGS